MLSPNSLVSPPILFPSDRNGKTWSNVASIASANSSFLWILKTELKKEPAEPIILWHVKLLVSTLKSKPEGTNKKASLSRGSSHGSAISLFPQLKCMTGSKTMQFPAFLGPFWFISIFLQRNYVEVTGSKKNCTSRFLAAGAISSLEDHLPILVEDIRMANRNQPHCCFLAPLQPPTRLLSCLIKTNQSFCNILPSRERSHLPPGDMLVPRRVIFSSTLRSDVKTWEAIIILYQESATVVAFSNGSGTNQDLASINLLAGPDRHHNNTFEAITGILHQHNEKNMIDIRI